MSAPATKRLQQDLKRLKEEPIVGAMAQPASDKDIMTWYGLVVGTEGTLLEGVPIRFCLEFSNDYPNSAPKAFFETEIFYEDGAQLRDSKGRIAVCLSIFGNFAHIHTEWASESHGWSPAYTVSTILISMQALLMANMLSNKPSDVDRMIKSALRFKCPDTGHDGSDCTKWFPQIITDPVKAAEITQMYRAKNPMSNTPLERFYICYANSNLNGNNSTIGYGVHVVNPRNGILSSPCEYLSKECFVNGNVRKSSTNKPFEFWLPILIKHEDWRGPKNIRQQFLTVVNSICSAIGFAKEEHDKVFKVCSSLMNSLVVEIMQNEGNATANDKFINGYFSMYRLLQQYGQDNPKLIAYSNESLNRFKKSLEARKKTNTPNVGEFLMHLTISSTLTWMDISQEFMAECEARNVFWYCVGNHNMCPPHPELIDPNYTGQRSTKVFNATTVSRNLVMFQVKFANVTKFLDMAELDSNYGLAPDVLTAELKNLYSQVVAVKDWDAFHDFVEMPRVSDAQRELQLVQAVRASAAQGYHRSYGAGGRRY
ncbi:Ubiquitin-conjugating enzyme E2 B [Pseudolycoriella hygida]|uniref:Ubiquitin-conjugating enzyme E2 B n=1 Tax=Pseudolycoriella hygida TaxID=35572 RepID=A0A9Q0MII8_9DIPT|nr:Ubiquitin-conjugating enzyme E2 B [Pseudolycoriella hygida]